MTSRTYPDLRKSILLILLFFLSFAIYFTIFSLIPQLLGITLSEQYTTFVFSFASPIATLPLIIFVSKKSGIPLRWLLSLPKISTILLLAVLTFLMVVVTNPLNEISGYITSFIDKKVSILYLRLPEFDLNLVIKFIGVVILAPIVEEYFIRKQILSILLTKYSPNLSIILSSAFFAIGHLKLDSIIYLFIWGLLLGVLYYRTNSIEIAILTHVLWNLAGLFLNEKYVDRMTLSIITNIVFIVISLLVIYLILNYLTRKYVSKIENNKPDQNTI